MQTVPSGWTLFCSLVFGWRTASSFCNQNDMYHCPGYIWRYENADNIWTWIRDKTNYSSARFCNIISFALIAKKNGCMQGWSLISTICTRSMFVPQSKTDIVPWMDGCDWMVDPGGVRRAPYRTVLIKQDQRQQFWDDGVVARISCVKGQMGGHPQDLRKVKAGDSLTCKLSNVICAGSLVKQNRRRYMMFANQSDSLTFHSVWEEFLT